MEESRQREPYAEKQGVEPGALQRPVFLMISTRGRWGVGGWEGGPALAPCWGYWAGHSNVQSGGDAPGGPSVLWKST